MRDLIFDTPWWLLVAIGVVGVAVLMSGNARQHKPMIRGGLAILGLGILLAVVSFLVDTPREYVVKHTHQLVKAVVDRDSATLGANLQPAAALVGWNRKQIIEGAIALADRFGLKSATITGIDTDVQPQLIVTRMRVVSNFQATETPYQNAPTDWEINWRPDTDGKWRVTDITPLGSGDLSGGQMSKLFFSDAPAIR